jgi:cytochrome c
MDDPVRQGAIQFGLYCSQCHTYTGEARIGPPLNGVIGRHVGSYEGYEYSDALASHRNDTWTRERVRRFVADPQATYPGTAMDQPYTTDEELDQIIRFLETRPAEPPARREGAQ